MNHRLASTLLSSLLFACSSAPADSTPPNILRPAPQEAVPPPAAPAPDPLPSGAVAEPVKRAVPPRERASVEPQKSPAASPAAAPPPTPVTPPATTPAPAPEPPKTSVRVPETAHVKVDVPEALQTLLDGDPRMVPWLANTMATIDRCHAQNPTAAGTVTIDVTMHENARPTPDIGTIPSSLRGVFACAMEDFMQARRMPLFTGPEGQKHALRVRLLPQ